MVPAVGLPRKPGAGGREIFQVASGAASLEIDHAVSFVDPVFQDWKRALVSMQMTEEDDVYSVFFIERDDGANPPVAQVALPFPTVPVIIFIGGIGCMVMARAFFFVKGTDSP